MSSNILLDGLEPVEITIGDLGPREDIFGGTDNPNLKIYVEDFGSISGDSVSERLQHQAISLFLLVPEEEERSWNHQILILGLD